MTGMPSVGAVKAKTFAYNEYRLELSNAPPLPDDRGELFQPIELEVTCGRPGPPGRPDRGVEVEVTSPPTSSRWTYRRSHRQWDSDSFCDHALDTAPQWVQTLAGKVVSGARRPAGVLYALQLDNCPVVAILQGTARISGTEWRIDLADAPAAASELGGDFQPTALLVLRSNIMSSGGRFRTSVHLVGTNLDRSPGSSGGKKWDSDALNPRYAFASMPGWVETLVREHTDLNLLAEA